MTKAAKISDVLAKFKGLGNLDGMKADAWNRLVAKIVVMLDRIKKTKMCFIAGTLVMARLDGVEQQIAIEQLERHELAGQHVEVWARDEFTGEMGWKPIVQHFTTHPDELVHLQIDSDFDGEVDETISGTKEHPFWVETRGEFVEMGELKEGDVLLLADGCHLAEVKGQTRERAPPGEVFTTYNFEVEDFHTYFVGESGVWVHNLGDVQCETVFTIFAGVRSKFKDDIWKAFDDLLTNTPPALRAMNTRWKHLMFNQVRKEALEAGKLSNAPWKKMAGQTLGSNGVKDVSKLKKNMDAAFGTGKRINADNVNDVTNFQAHHIVPGKGNPNAAAEALECNQILERFGIDLNEAANGVWLPKKAGKTGEIHPTYGQYHNGSHPTDYVKKILQQLKNAEAKIGSPSGAGAADKMRDELQKIGQRVFDGNIKVHL